MGLDKIVKGCLLVMEAQLLGQVWAKQHYANALLAHF